MKKLVLGVFLLLAFENIYAANSKKSAKSDLMDEAAYLKVCKKLIMEQDPGKDPKDADMLCSDPYLKGKAGESYEDQVRRKRLLKETDSLKEKDADKHVAPPSSKSVPEKSAPVQ